jgi:hypothetical protein
VIALPLLTIFCSGILFAFYLFLALLWTDHWAYRTNICLVEGVSQWHCKRDLEQKMQILIPPRFYRTAELWITPHHSRVKLILLGPLEKTIQSDLDLPLRSIQSPGSL